MPKFSYVAMDQSGKETKGTLEVASQNEAIARVKEMNLFPTKIVEVEKVKEKGAKGKKPAAGRPGAKKKGINLNIKIEQEVRIKVERDLEKVFTEDPELFGIPGGGAAK